MVSIFKGSATALVTPFNGDEDKTINFDALGRLIDRQIEGGADAILVCGSTGEASTLSDDEQTEVVRFAAERVAKRVPLMAGAGSNDTRHGAKLCKRCEGAGADALLLVTPYYNKTQQHGLIAHYTEMAKTVDIPIMIYSIKGRTGMNIEPATVAELNKIEHIVAIKEASGDIAQIAKIASLCDIDIYSGDDNAVLPVMSLGGLGVVFTVGNVIPAEFSRMTKLFFEGKVAEAAGLQIKYLPLIDALFKEVNPVPVKAALNMMGLNAGPCRMPLAPMLEGNESVLRNELERLGII